MADDATRWRKTADLDSRAGEPVGKALREAAAEVDRLTERWQSCQRHAGELIDRAERAEAERDALKTDLPDDVARQIAEVEAERAAMPEEERRRHEAADAPLLRLQLAGWYRQAKEAKAATDRVRALHSRSTDQRRGPIPGAYLNPYCAHCHKNWPCPSIAALDHPTEETGPVEHTGGNAEDCPRCAGRRDLAYPFICPRTDPDTTGETETR